MKSYATLLLKGPTDIYTYIIHPYLICLTHSDIIPMHHDAIDRHSTGGDSIIERDACPRPLITDLE